MTHKEKVWDALVELFVETGRGHGPEVVAKRAGLNEAQTRRALRSMRGRVHIETYAAWHPGNHTRCWNATPYGKALAREICRVSMP